jgi:hypothetical protein
MWSSVKWLKSRSNGGVSVNVDLVVGFHESLDLMDLLRIHIAMELLVYSVMLHLIMGVVRTTETKVIFYHSK